ncbi:metallophosphoesterase [Actinotalea sp. M2MS4P-6]|uniref:metallophosphoesterase n=1 Tax=Actinotalea sp. M2MS4P-6 TaxID=2983762 RepID=UPI0021E3B234|nr:metallophosphoesterase [Actinotalea sp. M2MS4P-6]MCV2393178.1 metallophosphoesterase [Actinotalea sp. M2MS4P-6]
MGTSTAARGLGWTALAAGAGLAYALAEAHRFTLRRFTVPVLPPGEAPLRVLHLSDLHLTPHQDDKIAWLRELAELEPHLVVDTGDNWAHRDALPALAHALDPLLSVPGAFVMGSNDYFAPVVKNPARYLMPDDGRRVRPEHPRLPADALARLFTDAGWVDLNNRRDVVVAGGRRLSLVGVDDPHLELDRFPDGTHDADAVLEIGVAHAPYRRVLDAMQHDGAQLILAGHTHGGQLAVPGWGALVTNCDLDTRRAKGLHGWPAARPDQPKGEDSVWLHVSAGLGTSPFTPVRFACPPEATLLTLVAR